LRQQKRIAGVSHFGCKYKSQIFELISSVIFMPLKPLPYTRLQHLIGLHLAAKEDPETQLIIDSLSNAKKDGQVGYL
jgi:hypothetical protein